MSSLKTFFSLLPCSPLQVCRCFSEVSGDVSERPVQTDRCWSLAGGTYRRDVCNVEQCAYLLHVKEECSNVMPLQRYFKAQHKFGLSHSNGKCVCFNLWRQAFSQGNEYNNDTELAKLGKKLHSNEDPDEIPLTASPCSRVTLPESHRIMVRRTCMCTVWHRLELTLIACMVCMDAARDSARRLVFLLLPSMHRIRSGP